MIMSQPDLPGLHPQIERLGPPFEDDTLLRCPECGHADILDGFDSLGADPDCVFCNNCGEELAL